jgi:peptide/nickel transport system substrate-binding protein
VDDRLRDPLRSQHHRSAQDLSLGRNRLALAAAILAAALTASGCGDDSAESVTPGAQPAPSGSLGIAIPDRPETLDPLLATSAADRLVVGQIYESLTRRVSAPYGQGSSESGLALWARSGAGGTIWRVQLRPGVRFSDGARFDAAAVLENAMRWRTTRTGQALLPGLVAADAPRPDLVRFIFDRPVADVPRLLASVQLGIVSPKALRLPNAGPRLANGQAAGTGPFELHRRTRREILLARNTRWWGTRQDLGPAVELISLRSPQSADRRLALLRRGTVQVAEGLGPAQARSLDRDPLLIGQPGPAGTLTGLSRAVRGFPSGVDTPMLSRAWLTTVGTGEG